MVNIKYCDICEEKIGEVDEFLDGFPNLNEDIIEREFCKRCKKDLVKYIKKKKKEFN